MLSDTTINHTAIHEAGHAVIVHLLRMYVYKASIVPDRRRGVERLGHVAWGYLAMNHDPGKLGSTIAAGGLAGLWAEMHHFGYHNGGIEADIARAARRTHAQITGYQEHRHMDKPPLEWRIDAPPKVVNLASHYYRMPVGIFTRGWREAWNKAQELARLYQVEIECFARSLLYCKTLADQDLKMAMTAALAGSVFTVDHAPNNHHIHALDLRSYIQRYDIERASA